MQPFPTFVYQTHAKLDKERYAHRNSRVHSSRGFAFVGYWSEYLSRLLDGQK
jgi:hypothetical protein